MPNGVIHESVASKCWCGILTGAGVINQLESTGKSCSDGLGCSRAVDCPRNSVAVTCKPYRPGLVLVAYFVKKLYINKFVGGRGGDSQ